MTKTQSGKSSAKDVFSYLLMIIMLYMSVISFIAIIWQYINAQFPDVLEYNQGISFEIIRNSISALLIGWPVFILISWMINKEIKRSAAKKALWIRKWLLYLTLFIASLTIIIDLITLTNSFLNGDLTIRFALKVLIILAVAIAVFWYYLWDLSRDPMDVTRVTRYSAIASTIVILISIIVGFLVIGSPAEQRALRMDNQRIGDLQSIQAEVLYYWQQKDELPVDLEALSDSLSGYSAPVDPITGDAYVYEVTGDLNFTICAVFSTDSEETGSNPDLHNSYARDVYPNYKELADNWTHGVGEGCFERTIDPELYNTEDSN